MPASRSAILSAACLSACDLRLDTEERRLLAMPGPAVQGVSMHFVSIEVDTMPTFPMTPILSTCPGMGDPLSSLHPVWTPTMRVVHVFHPGRTIVAAQSSCRNRRSPHEEFKRKGLWPC